MTCHQVKTVRQIATKSYANKDLPLYKIFSVPVPSSYFDCASNTYRTSSGVIVSPTQTFILTFIGE